MLQLYLKNTLFYCLLFCLFSLTSTQAQNTTNSEKACQLALEQLAENYANPSQEEQRNACNYIDDIFTSVSDYCEMPEGFSARIAGNSARLSWKEVAPAIYYQIGYTEIITGSSHITETDASQYTFINLPEGIYLFSVQAVCGEGGTSPPAFLVKIIIGDIAVISPAPINDCECPEQTTIFAGNLNGNDLLLSWQRPCKNNKYYLSIHAQNTVTGDNIIVNLSPEISPSGVALNLCSHNEPPLSISGTQVVVNDPTDPILTIAFSHSLGILLANQHPDYDFYVSLQKCCSEESDDGGSHRNSNLLSSTNKPDATTLISQPNPFSQQLELIFTLPQSSAVSIRLFDSSGRAMKTLLNKQQTAGSHSLTVNTGDLPAGLYFLELQNAEQRLIQKLIKTH
ncbi:MAG: T9SS type A sorting domain-containing protein [Bacteroidota bacterium]